MLQVSDNTQGDRATRFTSIISTSIAHQPITRQKHLMNSKELYSILFKLLQPSEGNKEGNRIARAISKPLSDHISESYSLIKNTDIPPRILTRDDIITELYTCIARTSGPDKLKYITELNKLEDNYKGKVETDIHITIVDYGSAELANTVKPSTLQQITTIDDKRKA